MTIKTYTPKLIMTFREGYSASTFRADVTMLERVHLGGNSGKVFYAADFANAQSLAVGLLEMPKPLLH